MTLRQKLFSFDGRLRRRDWWLLSLSIALAAFVLGDLVRYLLLGPAYTVFVTGWGALLALAEPRIGLLNLAVSVVFLWPYAAVYTKRRHDRGHGAALVLVALVWSYVSAAVTFLAPITAEAGTGRILFFWALSLVNFGVNIWVLVVLGILDGTPGPNRFGPSPKA